MKTITWLCTLLLTFGLSAFAQAGSGSSQSGDNSGMKQDSMKQDKTKGKKTSMTGCISKENGKFMLMDKKHPDGVELLSTQDLSAHVGHKVKIEGMMGNGSMGGGMSSSDSSMASNSSGKMEHDAMNVIQVNDVKMISEHCDMSMDKNGMKK